MGEGLNELNRYIVTSLHRCIVEAEGREMAQELIELNGLNELNRQLASQAGHELVAP
jgi:hypothetical protein